MRRPSPVWLLPASVLVTLLLAGNALAEDPAASALIDRGLDLRQAQHDAEALTLFEQAQALAPSPRGQAQVALAQQALGRWAPAEKNLKAALARGDDPWIASRRPVLEKALGVIMAHLGDVEVVGAKSGTIYVDGAKIDDASAVTRLRLEVGRRTFELRSVGSYPFSRVIDVQPGAVVRLEVEQHALLAEEPALAPRSVSVATPTAVGPASDPGHSQRTIGWIALGTAGAFLVTGGAGLVERSVVVSDYNGDAACAGKATSALNAQCRGWLNDGSTGQTLALVGFVGGGIVGAAAVALLLTAPSASPKTAARFVPCAPLPGGAYCGVTGSF